MTIKVIKDAKTTVRLPSEVKAAMRALGESAQTVLDAWIEANAHRIELAKKLRSNSKELGRRQKK